jgi:hypothetical protein
LRYFPREGSADANHGRAGPCAEKLFFVVAAVLVVGAPALLARVRRPVYNMFGPPDVTNPCGELARVRKVMLDAGDATKNLIHMYAREIDDEIVMERAEGGDLVRWIFFDIRPESFHWRSERSTEGGASWRLEQAVRADRTARPANAGDLPSPDAV